MSAFTGWKVLVNFLLPPPMLLTFLLVLPFPRNIQKGLLTFTSRVLSFPVLGGMKFMHLSLILSGVPLIDSGLRTYKSAQDALDVELTPNQLVSIRAKKWREERNFWIAAMAFTLWCLLTALYGQVRRLMRIDDELQRLKAENNELKGIKPPAPTHSKLADMVGLGRTKGRKSEDDEHSGNVTEPMETELTPAGPTVAARRRPAAAVGASME